ncbi:tape measure protein [Paracoccus cavernae]
MAESDGGLELPIGLTEKKFAQQLARIEAMAIKTSRRAEEAFKKSNAASARSFAALEQSAGQSFRGLQQALKIGGGLLAGGFVANQVRQFLRLSDAATKMRNSLRVAGLNGEELSSVYGKLFQSAQRNSAPISSLVDLYSKLSLTQKELGVSSDELIRFTDGIAVALRVGGTDAQAASGSLLQLSQALGGGVVRAEEFNSILEGTPTIAQAVARGLKEAGGSVAELRRLVVDGKVSSSAWFRAFQVGSEELRRQAETSQTTVGQAFTKLGNSILDVVGEFDKASGASASFARAIGSLGDGLDSFDAEGFIARIRSIAQAFSEAEAAGTVWLNNIGNADIWSRLNEATGTTVNGQFVNPDFNDAQAKIGVMEGEIEKLQAQIEHQTTLGFDPSEAIARLAQLRSELAAFKAEASGIAQFVTDLKTRTPVEAPAAVTTGEFYDGTGYKPPTPAPVSAPVSIADFPTAPTKPKGGSGGGGRKKTGGGGSKRDKSPADILGIGADEVRDIERSIQLIGLTTKEAATLEAQWEMLDAAKKAGVPVNDKLNAQIAAQAEQVGNLAAELEAAEVKQQQFDDAIDGIADSFAGALLAGESLRDGLAQVLKQIASDILGSGIRDALRSQFAGTGGGGFLSSLLGGFFGGGDALSGALRGAGLPARANGGSVRSGQAYLVNENTANSEVFVPSMSGAILNVPQAQAALRGGQGGGNATFAPQIHIAGDASEKTIQIMEAMLARENDKFVSRWRLAQKEVGQRT